MRPGGLVLETIIAELIAKTRRPRRQPEVVEVPEPRAFADDSKGVDVTVAASCPVFERDPELDGAAGHAQELAFIEIENPVKGADGGERGLAYAHRADLLGLDQRDVEQAAQLLRQRRRRAPARGAAPRNDDLFDRLPIHASTPTSLKAGRVTLRSLPQGSSPAGSPGDTACPQRRARCCSSVI